jgi:hypothetical protein
MRVSALRVETKSLRVRFEGAARRLSQVDMHGSASRCAHHSRSSS